MNISEAELDITSESAGGQRRSVPVTVAGQVRIALTLTVRDVCVRVHTCVRLRGEGAYYVRVCVRVWRARVRTVCVCACARPRGEAACYGWGTAVTANTPCTQAVHPIPPELPSPRASAGQR